MTGLSINSESLEDFLKLLEQRREDLQTNISTMEPSRARLLLRERLAQVEEILDWFDD